MDKGFYGFPIGSSENPQRPSSRASVPHGKGVLPSPARGIDAGPVGFADKFVPTMIAGCTLWLDASDDSVFTGSSGSRISQWRDKSGNNRHMNQTTEDRQPTRDTYQNGRLVVRSNGTTQFMTSALLTGTGTIFGVARLVQHSTSGSRDYFATGTTGGSGPLLSLNSNQSVGFVNQNIAFVMSTICPSPSGWQMQCLISQSGANRLYQNGTLVLSSTTALNNATNNTYLFANATGNFSAMEVAEIIVYNSRLADAPRIRVEQYLRFKWGTPNG